jgi:ATP-dependent Clp protease ATP-binding subunit ClpX
MSDSTTPPPDPPPAPLSPDEITRKIEDFIKNSLGGQVLFTKLGEAMTPPTPEAGEPQAPAAGEEQEPPAFDFPFRPIEIKAHLDRFVIRQDEAKKVLATAVCDHYNHARMRQEERRQGREVEFAKQNVLISGPTGVGKTYLVKHIAELIGVPFVKADATKFSETGYVGGDVDDLVRDLVSKANGNVELAEHGIIYLDEVDKLASGGERMGRDVSGRGVQTALLKLMEETEVPLHAPNDIRSQMQMMFSTSRGRGGREVVNTRHILFVVSGAFSGLEKIVEKRLNRAAIGFGAPAREDTSTDEALAEAVTRDFIDYGFEAEFIGRLPVRVVCASLGADDLFEIMRSSEGSLIRQYEREFAAYGIRVHFTDGALREVARRAAGEKTGARGLVTVWERVLRDFKFELPGTGLPELVVDEELVTNPAAALTRCLEAARALEVDGRGGRVAGFSATFEREHGLRIHFTTDAVGALIRRAEREGTDVAELCARLFKDYPFGLRLVANAGGGEDFTLDAGAVERPDEHLSGLVVRAHGRQTEAESGGLS